MLGNIEGRRRSGRKSDMIGWCHLFDGPEFEQAPGIGDGQWVEMGGLNHNMRKYM